MKIRDVAETVKTILESKPKSRDDDYLLYAFVLNSYGYSSNITFRQLVELVKTKQVPSMESIGRARRKAQELYENLRGTKYATQLRDEKQMEYIDFSQDKSI